MDNMLTLVQVMAWIQTHSKQSPEPWWPGSLMHTSIDRPQWVNSSAPGRFWWNFRWVIFKLILVIDDWFISFEIALRWMSRDLTDDKSTLVQVMAWCRQATSHYLSQCWPRSMSPYGVTRPQWVKTTYHWRMHWKDVPVRSVYSESNPQ